jgi:hypothetical protein
MEAIVVILPLAALVIDEVAQAFNLAAIDDRRADDAVIPNEVSDDEPPAPLYHSRRKSGQNVPIHGHTRDSFQSRCSL